MKKFFKKLILFLIIAIGTIYYVGTETYFFKDFEANHPELCEKYPSFAIVTSDLSDFLEKLPSPSQLIAEFKKDEMPIQNEVFSDNIYQKNSPMLNFYENDYIGASITGNNKITIFGSLNELSRANLIYQFVDLENNVIIEDNFSTDTEFRFIKEISFPETKAEKIRLDIYSGKKKYGSYQSLVLSYLFFEKKDGIWQKVASPVYETNLSKYNEKHSITKALRSTKDIASDNASIKSVAEQLTSGCETDYQKLIKIHDWICTYLSYDTDGLLSKNIPPYSATEVIKSRKAVCLGFANLYAAICRSINIPCFVVTGYALGISDGETKWTDKIVNSKDENHAWNEAYVDGRWVIIDSTWDTFNSIEGGEIKKGSHLSHLYFDSNIDFFSTNHKIVNYE